MLFQAGVAYQNPLMNDRLQMFIPHSHVISFKQVKKREETKAVVALLFAESI